MEISASVLPRNASITGKHPRSFLARIDRLASGRVEDSFVDIDNAGTCLDCTGRVRATAWFDTVAATAVGKESGVTLDDRHDDRRSNRAQSLAAMLPDPPETAAKLCHLHSSYRSKKQARVILR